MDPSPEPPPPAHRAGPDRDAEGGLSSERRARLRRARWRTAAAPAVILLSVAAAAATLTLQQPETRQAVVAAVAPLIPAALDPIRDAEQDPLWPAIQTWRRLRGSDRLPFTEYAAFLTAHPGWPGEAALRRAAERQIRPDGEDPAQLVAFFGAGAATNTGRVRFAEALAQLGRTDEARTAAAAAWDGGALTTDDEARLLARFGAQFTADEQDRRMERLLWDRTTGSAAAQLPRVSDARRPLYAARLAFQTRAPDAAAQGVAAGQDADRDAGFLVDRAGWLRDSGQAAAARSYVAGAPPLASPPIDPAKYLDALLGYARGAAKDGQPALAFAIARRADGAFAPATDISQRPLAERDPYTSLVWLGGGQALRALAQPLDAERMFNAYASASQSPGSRAKGFYWAARALEAGPGGPAVRVHYAAAARDMDQFYGQLATEKLGQPLVLPPDPPKIEIAPEAERAFRASELVRAARLLGAHHDWVEQSAFVRQIAQNARSDSDHELVDRLAKDMHRPDLAVIASRQARASGTRDPIRAGFPTIPVPAAMISQWTMVHALTRQESQFDQEALSQVGAKGLMQMMNPTAKEQAGKLGLPWDPARLTSDPAYNVMIGAAFFDRMLTYYKGSYVLAVASYNAGPGNVNRFLRDNGDPRSAQVDVIDWIEAIPFTETRAYVQKVLENAVVYDLMNPEHARTPERDRLNWYLNAGRAG